MISMMPTFPIWPGLDKSEQIAEASKRSREATRQMVTTRAANRIAQERLSVARILRSDEKSFSLR